MQNASHHASRTNFQLERFSFFSDGVFAIAITLLVIEIKVPTLSSPSDHELAKYLSEIALKFFSFIISFGVIGHYWSVHHRIFGYVKRSTPAVVWLNLLFLFSIVLLPFSSGLLGEYGSVPRMQLPYSIYVVNIIFTSLTNWLLWKYVSDPKRDLLTHTISASRIRLGVYRSLILPGIFIVSLLVSFVLPMVARFIPLFIPLVLNGGMNALEKKANSDEQPELIDEAEQTPTEQIAGLQVADKVTVEENLT